VVLVSPFQLIQVVLVNEIRRAISLARMMRFHRVVASTDLHSDLQHDRVCLDVSFPSPSSPCFEPDEVLAGKVELKVPRRCREASFKEDVFLKFLAACFAREK